MHIINLGFKGQEQLEEFFQRSATIPRSRLKKILKAWQKDVAKAVNVELEGGTLSKRTGALKKSVDAKNNLVIVETEPNVFLVTFKKKILVYGPFLEKGGTIKPTSKDYLAIPLRPSDRRNHTPPSQYKNKFVRPAKNAKDPDTLVMYWKRKKQKAIPIYILKREVEFDPDDYKWFSTGVANAVPELRKLIRNEK